MDLNCYKLLTALLLAGTALCSPKISAESPSTWNGDESSNMRNSFNWDNGVPIDRIAIFNGDGRNAPFALQDGGISFEQIGFTADTQVSVTTALTTTGLSGVIIIPKVTAFFEVFEHHHLIFPPARLTINGPAGDGGGVVNYSLEGFGQFYASSGSTGETIVNVGMTGGHNFFAIDHSGISVFDNVSSDSSDDEIFLFSNTSLTIRGADFNTINGVITGEGSLVKSGTGFLILNNNNGYNGDTLVNGGILELNGSVSGNLFVAPGAILAGNGTIGGNLNSSGTVSPGNSIGTLFTTNFLASSSNIYDCEVSAAGLSDQIVATQSAIVAGTLSVSALDLSFTAPQTYNILHAGTAVTGTFSNLTSVVPVLMKLTYDPNDVFLTYFPLAAADLNDNAFAAASCFVTLSGTDPNAITSELLSLTIPEIQQAFNQMQPSQLSALTWTQLENALLIRSSYSKHLEEFSYDDDCCGQCQSRVWVDGIGQWQHQNSQDGQVGYHDVTGGVSLGADSCYENFRFGAAASYTYSKLKWTQSAGSGQINSYYGGLYGRWSDDCRYINISALGAYNHYSTTRHLHFGTIDRHTHASHDGWEALVGVEAGFYSDMECFKVIPFGRVDYIYLSQQGCQEHGANSLDLHLDSRQDQLLQSEAGLVFTDCYSCGCQWGSLVPRLKLSYMNQTQLATPHYQASFADSSCHFKVSGWNFRRNLGAIGVDLTYLSCNERLGITICYDGQFGSGYWNQGGNISLNISY